MVKPSLSDAGQLLDELIAAFEAAQRSNKVVDLRDFLPSPAHPLFGEVLCELIRVDLEYGWARGSAKSVAEYAARFPGFFADAWNLQAVAYEEYRLRRQAGEAVTPQEYQARLGIDTVGWPTPSDGAFEQAGGGFSKPRSFPDDFAGATSRLESEMPNVGDSFAGFWLVAELGRGAIGRVYLARQADLANRAVALKISHHQFEESHQLAQLQHTNIVPVYSVHRGAALQAVCMPFFGSATLVDLIQANRAQGRLPDSGKAIVDMLAARRRSLSATAAASSDIPVGGESANAALRAGCAPAAGQATLGGCLPLLSGLTYVEAVLWIAARLADGLSHAHERGIWHRDLKPANILLADDGQPMLLDFNLSEDVKRRPTTALLGGTLPYMAPEQLAALRQGSPSGDARSDLYSLGVILYEMLAGHQPFPARSGTLDEVLAGMLEDRIVPPQGTSPTVPPAVQSIVAHCLETRPERRYQSAWQLKDDLERQLHDLPLRFARERTLRERAHKWMRRHPRLISATGMACLAGVLLLALGVSFLVRGARLARLEAGETFEKFTADFQLAQVQSLTAPTVEPRHWPALSAACRQALDRFGVLDDSDWQQAAVFGNLPRDKQQRVREDAGELLFLMAALARLDAGIQTATAEREHQLDAGLRWNRQAESCYASEEVPGAIWHQRGLLLEQLGRPGADDLFHRAAVITPKSVRDLCMLACVYVAQQRYAEALPFWQRGVSLDPRNIWAWYGLANCYERLSKPAPAAACYSACISLKPDYNGWYFGRGVAYLKQQEYSLAQADFDHVLEREPHHAEALVNRALIRLHDQQCELATADLTQAIADGADEARVYLIRAQAREQAGDLPGARLDRERGVGHQPSDESGWLARGAARAPVDSQAALSDFDQALQCNPRSVTALESKAHVLAEKLGQTESAVAALDQALEISPEHAPSIAARGVLLARLGRNAAALSDARRALSVDASAATQYQVAGIYALASRQDIDHRARALGLLSAALRQGYGSDLIDGDPDLEPLRVDPRFAELLRASRTLRTNDF